MREFQDIVDKAGEPGKVLVVNMQGARGVDIPISEKALELGGLHVRVTARSSISHDIDIQAENRAARSGQAGSVEYYISPEDDLIRLSHNPNVTLAVTRYTKAVEAHTADTTPQTADAVHQAADVLRKLIRPLQTDLAEPVDTQMPPTHQPNAPPAHDDLDPTETTPQQQPHPPPDPPPPQTADPTVAATAQPVSGPAPHWHTVLADTGIPTVSTGTLTLPIDYGLYFREMTPFDDDDERDQVRALPDIGRLRLVRNAATTNLNTLRPIVSAMDPRLTAVAILDPRLGQPTMTAVKAAEWAEHLHIPVTINTDLTTQPPTNAHAVGVTRSGRPTPSPTPAAYRYPTSQTLPPLHDAPVTGVAAIDDLVTSAAAFLDAKLDVPEVSPHQAQHLQTEFTARVQQLLAAHPWAQLSPTDLDGLTDELHYHLLDLLAELTDHAHSPAQPTETQPKISETDDEEEPIDQTSTVTPPSIPTLANGSNPTATDVFGATVGQLLPAGSHTTEQPTANHAHDADDADEAVEHDEAVEDDEAATAPSMQQQASNDQPQAPHRDRSEGVRSDPVPNVASIRPTAE